VKRGILVAATAALLSLSSGNANADGPSTYPIPAGERCPGPDFFFPGNGYRPYAYLPGVLTTISSVFRYSGPEGDEDWNFYIHPANPKTCPDGQQLFGRDCAADRILFLNTFWLAAGEGWRLGATIILAGAPYAFDAVPFVAASAAVTADERKVLTAMLDDQRKALTDDAMSRPPSQLGYAKFLGKWLGDPRIFAIGRKMWGNVQLDEWRRGSASGLAGDFHLNVAAEVQVSTDEDDDERDSYPTMLQLANLWESDGCSGTGSGPLCGHTTLMLGTAVSDGAHDGGKPEMHPVRALVTTDSPSLPAYAPATYRIRAFADFGKAGDGGGGSIKGHICENWKDNTLNGGSYLPYVAIPPQYMPMPSMPTTNDRPGAKEVVVDSCDVHSLRNYNLDETTADTSGRVCPTFTMDPHYRDDNQHRLYGGWAIVDVRTERHKAGWVTVDATLDKPESLGIKRVGEALGNGVVANVEAHWYKIHASSMSKAGTPLAPTPLDGFRWNLPATVLVTPPPGPHTISLPGYRSNDLFVPVAPARSAELNHYAIDVTAEGSYLANTVRSRGASATLPKPTVFGHVTKYAFATMTVRGGKPYIVYQPTVEGSSTKTITLTSTKRAITVGRDFIRPARYSWWAGKKHLADGASVTLKLTDGETGESGAELRGTDGYELAQTSVQLGIPETSVDAPEDLRVWSGASAAGKVFAHPKGGYCATDVVFHAQVKLQAKMFIEPNPYSVPGPSTPEFTWGPVQRRGDDDAWKDIAGTAVSGASHDTLTITLADPGVATDLMRAGEFRVPLFAVDGYSRRAQTVIYFQNWEVKGSLASATHCIEDQYVALPKIPIGALGPLARSIGPNGLGDFVKDHGWSDPVLGRAALFLNPTRDGSVPAMRRTTPSITKSRVIKVPGALAVETPRSSGPTLAPASFGLRSRKKVGVGDENHFLMSKIREMRPMLR
jgi:hypothetical protein